MNTLYASVNWSLLDHEQISFNDFLIRPLIVIKKLRIDRQTKRFGHNWYYYWRETHIHTELMNINVRFEHVNVGFHRSLPTLTEPCRTLTRSSRCVMTVSQLPMSCHCQQSKFHAAHSQLQLGPSNVGSQTSPYSYEVMCLLLNLHIADSDCISH